ncbi:RmlC-like cupin domain-containing protein [Apodospora peruviana]|uniref:RmlC-like cupin domain-containing protein n=1 Tax=Apodospora peruviana TaxID=516989 RepID=A0AAE0LYR5_9PEZI|nr:RmlC-like cupin domain-containing protein [Apodospora peruviana]
MFSKALTSSAATVLALSSVVMAAPAPASGLSLTAQLQLADTAVDKYQLLSKDSDFVFDFKTSLFPIATRKNFPALVGSGVSVSIATIDACGIAALHIHPRSAEIFVVLSGHVYTEMVLEGGVVDANGKDRVIKTDLTANMTTIFPQGSLHAQVNTDCTPALIVAAFTSEDPGAALIMPETLALPDDFLSPTFGGAIADKDLKKIRDAIPRGPFFQIEACRKKCNLK